MTDLSKVPYADLIAEIERRHAWQHLPRTPAKIELGKILTGLRKKMGLSGKQAAALCGCSPSFMSMAESGDRHAASLLRKLKERESQDAG